MIQKHIATIIKAIYEAGDYQAASEPSGKSEQEIAEGIGLPVDRELQIPYDKEKKDQQHPEFHAKPLTQEPDDGHDIFLGDNSMLV
jgi:hypothetical protein